MRTSKRASEGYVVTFGASPIPYDWSVPATRPSLFGPAFPLSSRMPYAGAYPNTIRPDLEKVCVSQIWHACWVLVFWPVLLLPQHLPDFQSPSRAIKPTLQTDKTSGCLLFTTEALLPSKEAIPSSKQMHGWIVFVTITFIQACRSDIYQYVGTYLTGVVALVLVLVLVALWTYCIKNFISRKYFSWETSRKSFSREHSRKHFSREPSLKQLSSACALSIVSSTQTAAVLYIPNLSNVPSR